MTKEKIVEKLKELNLDEKEKESFLNNLDIDIEKIIDVDNIALVDYDWGRKNCCCWIDTKKSSYQYYFSVQANPILSNDVNIALGRFYNYLGEIIFKNAFYDFEDKQVYFTVANSNNYKGLESTMTLLDAFIWMKDFLLEMLVNNNCDWENSHNERWNEYTEYLKPIFTVIDKIYNLESVYTLEYGDE